MRELTPEKLEEFIELITPKEKTNPNHWPHAGRIGTIEYVREAEGERYVMHGLARAILQYLEGHDHEFGEWKELRYAKGREVRRCSCGQEQIRDILRN